MAAYYNEHDPFAAAWLRELIKAGQIAWGVVDERSIEDVEPGDLRGFQQCHFFAGIGGWSLALRLAGWPDDRHVWTGSCPCQASSSAARGRTVAAELWPTFRDIIAKCRPHTVFGEQVVKKTWIDRVVSDFRRIDYSVGAAVLPALCVGQDHIRERFYFVGDTNSHGEPGLPVDAEASGLSWRRSDPPSVVRSNGVSQILAGFGNAIVPQVAAEFIQSYQECRA